MDKENDAAAVDERYLVPALIRGLAVLQAFSKARPRLNLSELAAAVGVTRSAAFRIVYTLDHLGFLQHDPATRSYTLGPQVLRLGYGFLAGRDIVSVAMPILERLRDRTGWSAHLGVLEGNEVLYLARVATRRAVASNVEVGSRLPAATTAMGRVLMAGGDTTEPVVSASGYEAGVAAVAAPVRDVSGAVVAAINISAVMAQVSEAELQGPLREAVREAANALSDALGFAPSGPGRAVP